MWLEWRLLGEEMTDKNGEADLKQDHIQKLWNVSDRTRKQSGFLKTQACKDKGIFQKYDWLYGAEHRQKKEADYVMIELLPDIKKKMP